MRERKEQGSSLTFWTQCPLPDRSGMLFGETCFTTIPVCFPSGMLIPPLSLPVSITTLKRIRFVEEKSINGY